MSRAGGRGSGPAPAVFEEMCAHFLEYRRLYEEQRIQMDREFAELFYAIVHTDCPPDCICTNPEGALHNKEV